MIQSTKHKLTLIFSSVILAFSLCVLGIGFYFHHQSIYDALEDDLIIEGKQEFTTHFFYSDIDSFNELAEDDVFQVLDYQGKLITSTYGRHQFELTAEAIHLEKAIKGEDVLLKRSIKGKTFLILYFKLSDEYIGLIAVSMEQLEQYQEAFLMMTLFTLPGLFLLSYLVSRYLVNLAMKPIAEAFRFQENFSSNVAHELLTPLTTLKGNLELSLRKERSVDSYREFIDRGLAGTNRIIQLLKDLHFLASAKFKPADLQQERIDLLELYRQIWDNYSSTFEATELAFSPVPVGRAWCLCDVALMGRVMENLLQSTLKYALTTGPFSMEYKQQGKYGMFSFQNSTYPINIHEKSQLFEPFFRAKNATEHAQKGKGLGLNLVRYIVVSHGGKVEANLIAEDRLEIRIYLPLAL